MSFKKYIGKRGGRPSPIMELEVDEICYLPQQVDKKIKSRIYQLERKTTRRFEYQECKNGGVVIRRSA